jgi:hypothetical protein
MSTGPVTKLYEQFEPAERLTLMLEAMARGDEGEAERLGGSCPRGSYTQRDVRFTERVDTAFDIMAIACVDLRCLWGKVSTLEWATAAARQMATHHQITATFAFMDGECFGTKRPQLDFFSRDREPDGDGDDDDDSGIEQADEPAEDNTALAAPQPLRASRHRQGELARRMMAVEDRVQVMTDYTFAALLRGILDLVRELSEVWSAYDRFCHDRLGVSAEVMLGAWEFPTGGEVMELLKRYGHVKPDPLKVDEYHGIYCRAWDRRFGEEE